MPKEHSLEESSENSELHESKDKGLPEEVKSGFLPLEEDLESVKERVDTLKRRTYRRVSRLKEELEKYEHKYNNVKDQIKDLDEENEELEEELEEKREKLSALREELEKLKEKSKALASNFKKKYKLLAKTLPIGMVILKSHTPLFVNNRFKEITGYEEEQDFLDLFTKESRKKLKKHFKSDKRKAEIELEAKTEQDSSISLEGNIIKAKYGGEPVNILLLKDLSWKTELAERECKVANLNEEVREEKSRIDELESELSQKQNTIEKLKERGSRVKEKLTNTKSKLKSKDKKEENPLLILTDDKGVISSINKRTTHILGFKLKDLVGKEGGKNTNIIDLISGEKEKKRMKKRIHQMFLDRNPIIEKTEMTNKQGESQRFFLRIELILDVDSEPIGLVNILTPLSNPQS